MLDVLNILIISLAFSLSVYGAYKVSGTEDEDRYKGFKAWQVSNIFWMVTFLMSFFGLLSPFVLFIQSGLAAITFFVYLLANKRGMANNAH